jgi:hypothetical protein
MECNDALYQYPLRTGCMLMDRKVCISEMVVLMIDCKVSQKTGHRSSLVIRSVTGLKGSLWGKAHPAPSFNCHKETKLRSPTD